QASPESLPRSLLKAVLSRLSWSQVRQRWRTPLFRLVLGFVSEALRHDTTVTHPWPKAERAYEALLDRIALDGAARAVPLDRTVYRVLFRFCRSACHARQGADDGLAVLALNWLSGDFLDPDEARRLGLPPGRGRDEPAALADHEQIKQVLVALTRMASSRGQPFVLCFDQVDN